MPTIVASGTDFGLTLAAGLMLVSPWKPVLLMLPFIPWGMYVTRIFDKHSAMFHLGRGGWNAVHLCFGLAALLLGLLVPVAANLTGIVGLIVGFFTVVLVLGLNLVVYPIMANKDERVPEEHRVSLFDFSKLAERRAQRADAKREGKVELAIIKPDKSRVPVPQAETPEFALRVEAERLFLEGRGKRATSVDLVQVAKDAFSVSYMVDTVRQQGAQVPAAEAVRVMDFWKGAANMDLAERRKRQQADIKVEAGATAVPVRVTTSGGQQGLRLSMAFELEKQVRIKAEKLGLTESQLKELREIVDEQKGVVLLAAPAQRGRTTMFYSVIRMHDAYTNNVQTVETEIQDSLEGAKHNLFDPSKEGQDFSKLVRSVLRRDPQVVGVAEMDPETAQEASRADLDRARVYLSLRAPSALDAVAMWVRAVEDQAKAGKCLHGVMAGNVLRKLCDNCRQPYSPAPDMLKKLGLPADKVPQLFRKGGKVLVKNREEECPACRGGGYLGCEGFYEVYKFGPTEQNLVAEGNMQGLRAELRKRALPTLQQAALKKVVDGITSVEEFARVTQEQPAKPATGAKPPAGSKPAGAPAPDAAKSS
ncbi:MAG: Flp pilus assembly complex ATPase component TadA [Phycisphaerales bacterium]|nr:Flp pilus assembly complex ATPase component TadA [Phycisphaerales bacterium]